MNNFNLDEYIMEHVLNSREWHVPFLPPIHLPQFLTLHGLMLIFCFVILVLVFGAAYRRSRTVPSGLNLVLEIIVVFIRDEIVKPCFEEEDARKMTPLFCTFFFFILSLNLMGLVPLFASATANVSVTGALALITLSFMIFGGIYKNGIGGFLKIFVPSGVPFPILLILTPLEFLGLFIKAFALMIRLFANMLAGHIAILALLGLVVLFGLAALPTIFLAVFISLLEVMVAVLQAYIFTLLSAVFIGQTYHPEH